AGIATSFKYPGVFLLVPLVLVSWREWRRALVGLALSAVAVAATSPYFFVHFSSALSRAYQGQNISRHRRVRLQHDHTAPIAVPRKLWQGFGPVLVICVAGLVLAVVRHTRTDVILASFVIVYFADLCTLGAHFDRYTLPLVPPLAALAGRIRALVPVTLLLLVVPLTWTIRDDVRLTKTDTRVVARQWIERHAPGSA